MPAFDSPTYKAQTGEPRRDVPADMLYSKQRHHSVPAFTFDAAQNDTLNLIQVPANALFLPHIANLWHTAFGASVQMDVGWLANDAIGLAADPDGLASNLDVAAAGVKNPFALKNTALLAMSPLWEWCGLSARPEDGALITLQATLKGANPAEGTICAYLPIRARG